MGAFAGWVNGIYIYPDASTAHAGFVPDEAVAAEPKCPAKERTVSDRELKASGFYIDIPAWMPSGAVETEGIYAGACGAKVVVVSRQFQVLPQGQLIGLVLRPYSRTAPFPADAAQVEAITVDGRPAVAVKSMTEDGSGNTAIFFLTEKGLLQVGAFDLRFDDLMRVAGSMNLVQIGIQSPLCDGSKFELTPMKSVSEATGQETLIFALKNQGVDRCLLFGYPIIKMRDESGNVIPFIYAEHGDQMITNRIPQPIQLDSGDAAYFAINKYRCDRGDKIYAPKLEIGLPSNRGSLDYFDVRLPYCGPNDPGDRVSISPFEEEKDAVLSLG